MKSGVEEGERGGIGNKEKFKHKRKKMPKLICSMRENMQMRGTLEVDHIQWNGTVFLQRSFFFQIKGPWSSVHAGGVKKRGKGNTKEAEDS